MKKTEGRKSRDTVHLSWHPWFPDSSSKLNSILAEDWSTEQNQLTSSAPYSNLDYIMHRKNGNSAGGHQLLDVHSGQQDKNQQKILLTFTIPRPWTLKYLYHECQHFKNLNMKTSIKWKNKPDLAQLGISYLSNEIKKGYQNLMRLPLF
jgi:hypothetical protein